MSTAAATAPKPAGIPPTVVPTVAPPRDDEDKDKVPDLLPQSGKSKLGRKMMLDQEPQLGLERLASSERDLFHVMPACLTDSMTLSIVVFGASGDLAKKKT